MLQELREKTQGWIAGVIIGFLILTMGLWGISSYMHGGNADTGVIVKFRGNEITQTQLDTEFNRFRMQHQNQLPDSMVAIKLLKQQLLEQLITQKLLTQAAKKNHLFISQNQIDSVLVQIPAFQVAGKFSQAQFEGIINQMLFTIPSFINNLQDTMLINQLQSGVMGSALILSTDITEGLALLKQQREFSYAILSKNRVSSKINISDTDIQTYYQNHQQEFTLPEKVSLQYVTLSAKDIMQKLKPTSNQLLQFYQNNIANYTQPVHWQVAHILLANDSALANKVYQQTKNSNFNALAEKYSQDPLTAKKGGVLPWFGPGQLDPTFELTVANLKKGEISTPVKTKYGYEIIKLLQIQPQQVLPYQQVSAKVKEAFLLQQAQKQFEDEKDQLANLSFENPNSLKNLATTLGLTLQTTPNFSREDAKTGITKLPQIVDAAFSQEVLTGNNSDVITVAPDAVVVLRVLSHQAESTMPIAVVANRIRQTLIAEEIKKQLANLSDNVIQAMNAGKTETQIAQQYDLTWRKVSAQLNTPIIDNAVLATAFNLPRPTAQQISIGSVAMANNDYAIVNITKVTDGNSNAMTNAERKAFTEQLNNALGSVEYTEYLQYLHNNAKIEYIRK